MRGIRKIVILVVVLSVVPMETSWILNGAKADTVVPLSENADLFRSFDLSAERLATISQFNEKTCDKLVLQFLYGKKHVPYFFAKQLEPVCRKEYTDAMATLLSDISCFPVAIDGTGAATISYENSWGTARNYGGDRRHEGVDLMTSNNVPGYFPAVSICDGVIEKLGWLELGGYRIGIRSEHGLYAYYAHLDSYREGLRIGDVVKAGDIVGYVGNTGYGPEGTKGQFDVHLHFGLYVDIAGKEVSVNPYEILRYLEN